MRTLCDGGRMRSRAFAWTVALAILVADQLSKWVMISILHLQQVGQITLLPIFNFTWTENRGISLGLAQAESELGRWLLVGMTAAIASGIAWWITREPRRGDQVALGMVLGGAIGNIMDRVRYGYVVDFLDLHFGDWRPFYVFNVSDAAISIGVVILLLRAFLARPAAPEETIDHA